MSISKWWFPCCVGQDWGILDARGETANIIVVHEKILFLHMRSSRCRETAIVGVNTCSAACLLFARFRSLRDYEFAQFCVNLSFSFFFRPLVYFFFFLLPRPHPSPPLLLALPFVFWKSFLSGLFEYIYIYISLFTAVPESNGHENGFAEKAMAPTTDGGGSWDVNGEL